MDKLLALGIDPGAMLIYLLNSAVLIALLTYFFYRPMIKFIDDRRAKIQGSIDEAERLRNEFKKELDKVEEDKAAAEAELKAELDKLRSFTEEKRTELLAEMEAARSTMMEKAQAEIDQKKESLIKEVEADVMKLMTRIILDIVENKVPEDVIEGSIKTAWKNASK